MDSPAQPRPSSTRLRCLRHSQTVPRDLDHTFAFFADPWNLPALTPAFVHFRFLQPPPPRLDAGVILDYQIRLFGVPVHWQTLIQLWEPPLRFVDVQVAGPYKFWRHAHRFEAVAATSTTIVDDVVFALPFGVLGDLAYRMYVGRTLRRIFDFRAERLQTLLAAQ